MPKANKKRFPAGKKYEQYKESRSGKLKEKLEAKQPPAPAALPPALPAAPAAPAAQEYSESEGEFEPTATQDTEDTEDEMEDVQYGEVRQVALPQPSDYYKLTDNETINYYLHYLAIIDNIHDFFHKRGEKCPTDFKKKIVAEKDKLEAKLQESGINTELFLTNRVTETVMGEFESAYTIKILNQFGLKDRCHFMTGNVMDDKFIYQSFIQLFKLGGKTFYTTHDSAFKKKKFRFDSKKEAGFNCKHYILKTPQNNFDSATSSASSSVIKKKTVIVYPENHVGVDGEPAWIFKSNILTQTMGGKMSFKYAPERTTGLLGSLALWKLFNGRKATFNYKSKGTTIKTTFKPIGAFGGTESGPGPKLLCESISQTNRLTNPKTVAKKIYNEIVGNTTLNPDEKYYLILDLKRSGDWEQVLAAIWFKENSGYKGSENTIVITGDYLCFLFAAINNVDCVFLGAKNSLFYSDKIRQVLNCGEPIPSLKQSSQTGGDPDDEDYFYTEEDYMDDFYTLLKNIRHNTMSWHYETIDGAVSEDYYNNIYTLITNFNDATLFENFKTSLIENFNIKESNIKSFDTNGSKIYENINQIIQLFKMILLEPPTDSPNEPPRTPPATQETNTTQQLVSSSPKNTATNIFYQSQTYPILGPNKEYNPYRLVSEMKHKKIFLMSICILFEYLSLYYEGDQTENDLTVDTSQLGNLNIKPGFPHIIESFYYFIITNIIYKRNDSFNLRHEIGYQTIIIFLANTYSLLGKGLLEYIDLTKPRESFNLQGFSEGAQKEIFLERYYPDLKDNITGQDYYIKTAREFLFSTTPSSSQSQGGARKNKMIRQMKKKKTKRKHIKKKTKRKKKIKGRKQKEENKTKNKKKKRKKTRRKKKIKLKKTHKA